MPTKVEESIARKHDFTYGKMLGDTASVIVCDRAYKRKRVCTNIMNVDSEEIAAIYKARWQIETFFRLIKQNYVFNQLYGALI